MEQFMLQGDEYEVYEDFEEHVDFSQHERARRFARRKEFHERTERALHKDAYDEFYYGDDPEERVQGPARP